jgi:hypothetical protein
MSHVIAAPEVMTSAATDLATIGLTLDAAHSAAAPATVAVTPAAADEVSLSIAHLFSLHAQDFQALARQAAAFQEQFVQNLKVSAASYTSIDDAIASLLKSFSASMANAQYHVAYILTTELPYTLAHFGEFLTYVITQLALAPIVFTLLALVLLAAAVNTLIQSITSLLSLV